MNSAVLQGTIMATASHHGIHRINRHANRYKNYYNRTCRIASYLNALKNDHDCRSPNRGSLETDDPLLRGSESFEYFAKETAVKPPFEAPLDRQKPGFVIANPQDSEALLTINVGGSRFVFRIGTLLLRNDGLLSCIAKLSHENRLTMVDAFFEETKEYYFERQPTLFHTVYQFYLTGRIHQPPNSCPQDILDELDFWGIDPTLHFAPCCCYESDMDEEDCHDTESNSDKTDDFQDLRYGSIRRCVWKIIEEPTSSIYAQAFAFFSVLFVLISISGLVLGSIPDLQVPVNRTAKNSSVTAQEREPHPYLIQIEYVCIVWFSFEYVSKMIVSANRWRTFRQLLNIIDLLAILPFLMEMALLICGVNTSEQLQDLKGAFLVIRILRVLRVIRVLKLGRYSSGLQMFGKTLQASFRQLGMMAMVVLTGVIFFSTLVYFLEKDEPNSQFYSIPAACWWSIVTMSTVGYGDLTPTTVGGKLVATVAIACGVLVLALPITIIAQVAFCLKLKNRRNRRRFKVDNFMKVAEAERRPGFAETPGVKRLGPRARVITEETAATPTQSKSIRMRKVMSEKSNHESVPISPVQEKI